MLAIRMANNTAIVIILKKLPSHQGRMGCFVDRVFTPVRNVNTLLRGSLTPYGMRTIFLK